jgi:peptide/nickel transport system ATP-binding protein/oligopeptide transport system ATP-binding protein
MADEVAVMYAGRVVERASAAAIFASPQHPYTLGLLGSIPRLDEERERLLAIEGTVPPPFALPKGCRFAPRCPFAEPACEAAPPPLVEVAPGHLAACRRAPVEAIAA